MRYRIINALFGFLGLALIISMFYALDDFGNYMVNVFNVKTDVGFYGDLFSGLLVVIVFLIFLVMAMKLRQDSFLQRLSHFLMILSLYGLIFYAFYIVIRLFNTYG